MPARWLVLGGAPEGALEGRAQGGVRAGRDAARASALVGAARHGRGQGGCASVAYNLGVCYMFGEGVAKDFKLAAHLLSKAADQALSGAAAALDCCLAKLAAGGGIERGAL